MVEGLSLFRSNRDAALPGQYFADESGEARKDKDHQTPTSAQAVCTDTEPGIETGLIGITSFKSGPIRNDNRQRRTSHRTIKRQRGNYCVKHEANGPSNLICKLKQRRQQLYMHINLISAERHRKEKTRKESEDQRWMRRSEGEYKIVYLSAFPRSLES